MSQDESSPGRISTIASARVLKAGNIELDPSQSTVFVRGKAVRLTSKEFGLLQILVESRGAVVSRDLLFERVWGSEKPPEPESHTVNVHVHRLRRKLGPEGRRVLTVRNVGYRYDISTNWIKFGT